MKLGKRAAVAACVVMAALVVLLFVMRDRRPESGATVAAVPTAPADSGIAKAVEPPAAPTPSPAPEEAQAPTTDTLAVEREAQMEETVVLRGVLKPYNPNGFPVAGLRLSTRPFSEFALLPAGYSADVEPAETTTDAQGRFQLRVMGGRDAWVLFHDPLNLIEKCPGPGGHIVVKASTLSAPEPPVFRMRDAVHLQVTVVEPDGSPLAEEATLALGGSGAVESGPYRVGVGGRIDLSLCEDRSGHLIAERGSQRGDAQLRDAARGIGPTPVTITLRESASLAGRALDVAGLPLSGIAVFATTVVDGHMLPHRLQQDTRSDSAGHWRIEGMAPGEVRVYARPATNDATLASPSPEFVFLDPGEHRSGIEFVLLPAKTLEGRVVDGSGEPIPDARVEGRSPTQTQLQAETDAEGRFRIGGIEPHFETFDLAITATGHGSRDFKGLPLDGTPVELFLRSEGTVRIRARVAVTGAFLEWFMVDVPPREGFPPLRVHASGGLAVLSDLPKDSVELLCTAVDAATGEAQVGTATVEPRIEPVEVTIDMAAPPVVRGVVVLADGNAPVEGALVTLGLFAHPHSNHTLRSVQSRADGTFELPIPEMRADFIRDLWAEKGDLQMGAPIVVNAALLQSPVPVTLVLSPPGIIVGRIVDPGGSPHSEASLSLSYTAPGHQGLRDGFPIAPDGTFQIEGLRLGRYGLLLGFRERSILMARQIDLSEQHRAEVEFDTSRLVTVTGAIRTNGASATSDDEFVLGPLTATNHRKPFRVPNEARGRYVLRMEAGELLLWRAPPGGGWYPLAQRQVESMPRVLQLDFDVTTFDLGVAVIHPGMGDKLAGEVFIMGYPRLDGDGIPAITSGRLALSARIDNGMAIFSGLSVGRYQARFQSRDGVLVGMSRIVEATAAEQVTLEIVPVDFMRYKAPPGNLFE